MRAARLAPLLLVVAIHSVAADESMAPYSVADTTAARVAIERARAAFAAGEPGRACDEIQRVLLDHRDDLIIVSPDAAGGDRPQTLYRSAASVAVGLLLSLPEKDRAVYEEKAGPPARALFEAAEASRDEAGLRAVLDRYGATSVAPLAARRLVQSLLESGRPRDAAAAAADALALRPLDADLWARRIDALAIAREGEMLSTILLPSSVATTTIAVGGNESTVNDRLAAAKKATPLASAPVDVPAWGGGPAHDVRSPWDQPLRPRRWAAGLPPPIRDRDHGPMFPQDDDGSASNFSARLPIAAPYFPIATGRALVISDGFGVEAREILSGRPIWRYPTANRHRLADDAVRADESMLRGRTNLDVAFAPCADHGLVFATIEVEDRQFVQRALHGTPINTYKPLRVLIAVDALTGEPRWRMGATKEDAAALEGVSIGGGPVAADGLVVTVGVKFEKRWVARVLAFEQQTGRLRWSRDVVTSQQELNLFGEPVKELWAGTPAVADGTVYAPTGLGILVALDLRSGAVRWMSSYDTIEISRVIVWFDTPLRLPRWGPSPVVAHGDAVLLAPADGPHLLCFDRKTGVLRWREEAESRPADSSRPTSVFVDYFVGVGNDGQREIALTTGSALRALDLADGNVVWSSRLAQGAIVRGRGAISTERVYVPTDLGLDVFSLPGEGRLLAPSPAPWPLRSGPGNLLLTPRVLVASRGLGPDDEEGPAAPVQVFYDPDDIERDIEKRRKASPGDPKPLVELADLWRLVGRDVKAQAGYEDAAHAAEAAHDVATADRAREGMILLARDRGDAFKGLGATKAGDARSAYEAGLARAVTPAEKIMMRLRLDSLFRQPGNESAQIRNLAALVAEAGTERATFSTREGEVPARPAGRFLLATLHRRAGRTADAVAVLQDVLREDSDAMLAGETAWLRAKRLIDEILADPAGSAAYRRHDVEADRLLFEASKGTDPQAFERILREFPNARAVPAALIGLAQRQAAAGKSPAAVATLSKFLAGYADRPQAPLALALLSRAFEATGALDRARAALAALERRHGDARFEFDGKPTTGREFARAERDRVGAPPPRAAPRPLARSPQERMTERVDAERVGATTIEVDGAADASFSVPALVGVDDDVIAVDPESARVRWRRTLSDASRGASAAVVGDAIVVASGESVTALDPASGDVRWTQELPGHSIDVGATLGLAVVWVQLPSAGVSRSSLVAFDPLTGARAWTRDLSGAAITRMLVGADGIAVARRKPDSTGALSVTLYASLTGEPTADLPRPFDGWTDGSPQIVDGRRILGVTRGSDGVKLEAFELATGAAAWSAPLSTAGARSSAPMKRRVHVRGGQAVVIDVEGSIRTFDVASGAALGETKVTGGLLFIGDRSVVMLDDRLVAITRERGGRTAIAAFDRRTGRVIWSKDALTDAAVVSDGLLIDGDGVVVAVLAPARPFSRPTGAMSEPPDYQIAIVSPEDGSTVRISAPGLGDFRPSATLVDGMLVVAGRQRFAAYR